MPNKVDRLKLKAKGLCQQCGSRPPKPNRTACAICRTRQAVFQKEAVRTKPLYWAHQKAERCRSRVRKHNSTNPDRPLFEKIIDGPSLLAAIIAHGPTCGLCGTHTGFPWEHVGLETGPEVDHILSMWAILNDGRQDWASVSNVRLLCVGCHSTEGIRLKRQDIEERAHMERMLAKDHS